MSGCHLPPDDAERWLSAGRLTIYTDVTDGDTRRALDLYDWNARATAACLHDVGHLEVLLRNRYDTEMVRAHPNWTNQHDDLWQLTSGNAQTRAAQDKANRISKTNLWKAARHPAVSTHGHVVANLTFGFWTNLTTAERVDTLWTPILASIFSGSARGPVHDKIYKLNNFRNRLAHWEPLFSGTTGLLDQLVRVDDLFNRLDPAVAAWVGERSQVLDILRASPEPVLGVFPSGYLGVV